jgi:hypothetical protein
MVLKSEGFATNLSDPTGALSLAKYCEEAGIDHRSPISLTAFTDYGLWFLAQVGFGVETVEVDEVEAFGDLFRLRLTTGRQLLAANVVVATGLTDHAVLPPVMSGFSRELVSHTADHADLSRLPARDVTIIGAGQAALESAALLAENGKRVRVIARAPSVAWHVPPASGPRPWLQRLRHPKAGLGPGWHSWIYEHAPWGVRLVPEQKRIKLAWESYGPAGAWWLRDRVEGCLPVITGASVLAVRQVKARLLLVVMTPHGRPEVLSTDHLLCGTGFQVSLKRIRFLNSVLSEQIKTAAGSPVLSSSFECSVPRLYFTGASSAVSMGPLFRFVVGTRFTARRVAAAIARDARPTPRVESWGQLVAEAGLATSPSP